MEGDLDYIGQEKVRRGMAGQRGALNYSGLGDGCDALSSCLEFLMVIDCILELQAK